MVKSVSVTEPAILLHRIWFRFSYLVIQIQCLFECRFRSASRLGSGLNPRISSNVIASNGPKLLPFIYKWPRLGNNRNNL